MLGLLRMQPNLAPLHQQMPQPTLKPQTTAIKWVLGRWLGPSTDIGPALRARILN